MATTPQRKTPSAGGLQAARPRPTNGLSMTPPAGSGLPMGRGLPGGVKGGQGPMFGGGGPMGRWTPTMGTGGMQPSTGKHPAMPSMPGMLPQRQPAGGGMMWAGGSPNFNEATGSYSQPFIPRNGGFPGMPGGGMMKPGMMQPGGMQQGQVNPQIQQAMMRMLMQRMGGLPGMGTNLGMARPGGGMIQAY